MLDALLVAARRPLADRPSVTQRPDHPPDIVVVERFVDLNYPRQIGAAGEVGEGVIGQQQVAHFGREGHSFLAFSQSSGRVSVERLGHAAGYGLPLSRLLYT